MTHHPAGRSLADSTRRVPRVLHDPVDTSCTISSVSEESSRSCADDVAELLEHAADVHEAEGRTALAKRHRRAARRLDPGAAGEA